MPYCQQAPKNPELNGLFQCQFQGADPKTFVGGIAVGQPGTIPFGKTAPLSPAGSCPANPGGPIAAGSQLVSITQNPGVGGAGGSSGSGNASKNAGSNSTGSAAAPPASAGSQVAPVAAAPAPAAPSASSGSCNAGSGSKHSSANSSSAAMGTGSPATNNAATAAGGSGFKLQNGKDAQQLNAKFATLSATSSCTSAFSALPYHSRLSDYVFCLK